MTRILAVVLASAIAAGPVSPAPEAEPTPTLPHMIRVGKFNAEELSVTEATFLEQLKGAPPVVVFEIDSPGGQIMLGLKFIKEINHYRKQGLKTVCVVDPYAASMGFVFLQAACDVRLMTKGAVLLAHRGSAGAEGTVEEMEESVQFLQAMNFALSEIEAARLNITVEEFRAHIEKHAWTMGWAEALQIGAIDGTVDAMDLPVTEGY